MTVEWFEDVIKSSDRDVHIHKLLLGTHTSGDEEEPNYLMIADVCLPKPDAEILAKAYDDTRGEVGGFGDFLTSGGGFSTAQVVHRGALGVIQ